MLTVVSTGAFILSSSVVFAATSSQSINTSISNYFSQLDNSITNQSNASQTSMSNGTQSTSAEQLESQALGKVFQLANDRVTKVTSQINSITPVAGSNSSYTVDVFNTIDWVSNSGQANSSVEEVLHTITLDSSGNVTNDSFNDWILGVNSNDLKTSQTNLQTLSVVKSTSSPAASSSAMTPQTSGSYNATAAVNYANKWAKSNNTAQYPVNWSASDLDCADFVSQSLVAGGIPQVSGVWAYNSGSNATYDWINANGLDQFWANNPSEFTYIGHEGSQYVVPGDVIYVEDASGHSEIVDAVSGGTVYMDCHSSDAQNFPADTYNTQSGATTWLYYRPL